MADAAPELAAASALARGLWPAVDRLSAVVAGKPELLHLAEPLWAESSPSTQAEGAAATEVALALACGLAATRAMAELRGEAEFDLGTARAHVPLPDTPLGRLLRAAIAGEVLDELVQALSGLPVSVDACAHLYDALLKRSDSARARRRGVYYTPKAVARHIVERADRLLVELDGGAGLLSISPERGLVDPATGTGVFLCEVIDCAYRAAVAAGVGSGADRDARVRAMLPALRGYELLPVPRAMCHVQLALTLLRRGGRPDDALRVSLSAESFLSAASGPAAGDVAVVIGNPPYRRGAGRAEGGVRALVDDYRRGLEDERNLQPLSDDYIKFVRVAQHLLSARGDGVLAMVVNHGLLRGRLHRSMRRSLRECFGRIEVLDLHGNVRVREADSARDGNVFDIGQGVCVLHMTRGLPVARDGVYFAELRGDRSDKLMRLRDGWLPSQERLECAAPYHLFAPQTPVPPEYARFHPLPSLFGFHSVGAKPGDDRLLVGRDAATLLEGLSRRRAQLDVDRDSPRTEACRRLAARPRDEPFEPGRVEAYAYRPFDTRLAYYDETIWTRPLMRLREAMAGQPALLTTRIVKDTTFAHVFATAVLPDVIALSSTSSVNAYAFPRAALQASALAAQLAGTLDDDALFAYVYAVLHSPGYRARYLPAMRHDFPSIPAARVGELSHALVVAGRRLLELHLGTAEPSAAGAVHFHDGGDRTVRKVGERRKTLEPLSSEAGRLRINEVSYFEPVALAVWNARVGAYRVAHKWLDDRRRAGGALDDAAVQQYRGLLAVMAETLELQRSIDAAVLRHGGYPDAFH